MHVAVAGARGRIGSLTVAALERSGHKVTPISRSHGVDVIAGAGLDDALAGTDAVVDVLNSAAATESEAVAFFTTATRNLLAAERRAGVGHHVVLSIACLHNVAGNAHYAGKRAQEAAVEDGPIPYTIVPATQFHDFAAMIAARAETGGVARIAPLLLQPIAPADVAEILARVAAGAPQRRHRDIAGPGTEDMVDMARRTHAAQGKEVRLVPTWHSGIFSTEMAGDAMLPGADAEIAPTSFEEWLATQAA